MIILIYGGSHTGKTALSQKLLEKYHFPYLSIDHLKMGLIRSGQTKLTPMDDDELTPYLWNIVKEMIKTAIENKQNMIVEGCYIPHNWKDSFEESYLREIRSVCLIMSEKYINENFDKIKQYAGVIEQRLDDSDLSSDEMIKTSRYDLEQCIRYGTEYILIDERYEADLEL